MDKQAVIPALQLLLADFSDEDRSMLFGMAFPNGFVLTRSDAAIIRERLGVIRSRLENIIANADGSSPLGIIGVKNINADAQSALTVIRTTAGILSVNIG